MKELTMTDSEEQQRDKTVADTFPASDPPANSGITGAEPAWRPDPLRRHVPLLL
jgi:hypothetical protein